MPIARSSTAKHVCGFRTGDVCSPQLQLPCYAATYTRTCLVQALSLQQWQYCTWNESRTLPACELYMSQGMLRKQFIMYRYARGVPVCDV